MTTAVTQPKETSGNFLPEICTPQAILRVMLGAQVLAVVLALTSASETYLGALLKIGLTSLFIQWVALSSVLVICLLSNKLKKLSVTQTVIAISGLVVLFTIGASVVSTMADSYQNVGALQYWDTPFILRNSFIALTLTLMVLHYFHLLNQKTELTNADTGAQYDALHFICVGVQLRA